MAFSADEVRVLRRALAEALGHPAVRRGCRPLVVSGADPGGRVDGMQDCLRLAEAWTKRQEAARCAASAGRAAPLPARTARRARGYLERLAAALTGGYLPGPDDLSALRRLPALPCRNPVERRAALLAAARPWRRRTYGSGWRPTAGPAPPPSRPCRPPPPRPVPPTIRAAACPDPGGHAEAGHPAARRPTPRPGPSHPHPGRDSPLNRPGTEEPRTGEARSAGRGNGVAMLAAWRRLGAAEGGSVGSCRRPVMAAAFQRPDPQHLRGNQGGANKPPWRTRPRRRRARRGRRRPGRPGSPPRRARPAEVGGARRTGPPARPPRHCPESREER